MLYIVESVFLILQASFLSAVFRRKIEFCIAPAACIDILILYLFGICSLLSIGVAICAVLAVLSACGSCFLVFTKRYEVIKNIFTPLLILFFLFILYFGWARSGQIAIENDEFSHWAYTVKMMFEHKALSASYASEMIFPSYPPALALWEYLFIIPTGVFSESYIYRAFDILAISFLLPLASGSGKKNPLSAVLTAVTLFLLPLAIYTGFYTNLCVDGMLALMFSYLLYIWFENRKRDAFTILSFSACSAVLVLTKESGLFLAIWALLMCVLDSLNRSGLSSKGSSIKNKIIKQKKWAIPLAFVVCAKLSWTLFLNFNGISSGGSGSGIKKAAAELLNPSERTLITVRTFLRKLFLYPETEAPLRLSVMLWLLIGICMLEFSRGKLSEKRNAIKRLQTGLVIGFAVYAAALLYLYIFSFGEYEGTRVFSFWRYLGSWVLVPVLLGVSLAAEAEEREEKRTFLYSLLVLTGSFLVFPYTTHCVNQLVSPATENAIDHNARAAYSIPAELQSRLSEKDRIYFVFEDGTVYDKLCAAYCSYPIRCDSSVGYNFNIESGSMYADEVLPQEFEKALIQDGYSYVWLCSVSDGFINEYSSLFVDPAQIVSGAFFTVDENPGGVLLRRVQ